VCALFEDASGSHRLSQQLAEAFERIASTLYRCPANHLLEHRDGAGSYHCDVCCEAKLHGKRLACYRNQCQFDVCGDCTIRFILGRADLSSEDAVHLQDLIEAEAAQNAEAERNVAAEQQAALAEQQVCSP
jgi:hypothetical protein